MIVDDAATNRIVLKAKLTAAFHLVEPVASGRDAIDHALATAPDLFVIGSEVGGMTSIDLVREMRARPALAQIPIIMMTSGAEDPVRIEALAAGVDEFLPRRFDDALLLARIRSLLRQRDDLRDLSERARALQGLGMNEPAAGFDGPARVDLISANLPAAVRWRKALSAPLRGPLNVRRREELLAPGAPVPDVVFIAGCDDAGISDSLRLVSEIRSNPATRFAAICLALPVGRQDAAAIALDIGADDVFSDTCAPAEVALRIRRLQRRRNALKSSRACLARGLRLAATDPLTGLHNRHYAIPALRDMLDAGHVAGQTCAVMVMDIDRFKAVNDRYGHAVGDQVLQGVAQRLSECLGGNGLLARIGGEEFLAAAADTDIARGWQLAHRLCDSVAQRPVALRDGRSVPVTISVGLAFAGPEGYSTPPAAETVIERADFALLTSKGNGRNMVTLHPQCAA